jgi:manganese transport protein
MKKLLEVSLGIVTMLGGFVDIGDLVFASQAGAKFGLHLLWALALGTLMIMLYAEMSGRVATVAKLPAFTVIRNRFPKKLNILTLSASSIVNIMTCAAEIGGVALILQLLSGLPYLALIVAAFLALLLIVWLLPFNKLEKVFGYFGLGLLILAVVAIKSNPDWAAVGQGYIPHITGSGSDLLNYAYFAIGIIAAALMPYEIYFYSSGAIEEEWKPQDLIVNKINAIVGFGLGGLLVSGIIIASAHYFESAQISPEFIHTTALEALVPFGQAGLLLVLLGMLFSIGGAVVETSFAGAYNLSQYMGWKWGKHLDPLKTPHFTLSWLAILLIAFAIIMTGFDPINLTEYAVIFSVVVMPLTYWPILKVASDKNIMGKYANKTWNNILAWIFFVIIIVVSLAAVPLMVITQKGTL